jgi:hypothetical protein
MLELTDKQIGRAGSPGHRARGGCPRPDPRISRHVPKALSAGRTLEKIHFVRDVFTPCTLSDSLLEAVTEAAKNATADDVILLSPAGSNFNQVQNDKQNSERFWEKVKSISWGRQSTDPNRHGKNDDQLKRIRHSSGKYNFSPRGFLRKNHGANSPTTHPSQKGRDSAKFNE